MAYVNEGVEVEVNWQDNKEHIVDCPEVSDNVVSSAM